MDYERLEHVFAVPGGGSRFTCPLRDGWISVKAVKSRRWMKSSGAVQSGVQTFPVFPGKALPSLLRTDVTLLPVRSILGKTQG